jgi:ribose transport system permease protein
VITATIIGGASLNGGEGSVFGAFLGALFMGMVANALNLLGVDAYWQNLVTGLILIIAVLLDVINERRRTAIGPTGRVSHRRSMTGSKVQSVGRRR